MFGNFTYCNPTKLYFGEDALNGLNTELPKYGKNVVLIYGGGSIKKNGIYDEVIKILKDNGKNVAEISGVMPNPTVDKLYGGVETARRHKADLLLAVGGGSVCDYAKAVSVSVNCDEDPWEKFTSTYEVGSVASVRVVKLMTFGAFAEIVPGVDGLIHISQIADHRIEKPGDELEEGQIVDVKITDIDYDRKNVSLSIRALLNDNRAAAEDDGEED